MGLDYHFTCPTIDGNIKDFKSDIAYYIEDVIEKSNEGKAINIDVYVEEIYRLFGSYFEEVRKTNEGMRNAADKQISNLLDQLADASIEINELTEQIKLLEV